MIYRFSILNPNKRYEPITGGIFGRVAGRTAKKIIVRCNLLKLFLKKSAKEFLKSVWRSWVGILGAFRIYRMNIRDDYFTTSRLFIRVSIIQRCFQEFPLNCLKYFSGDTMNNSRYSSYQTLRIFAEFLEYCFKCKTCNYFRSVMSYVARAYQINEMSKRYSWNS